MDYLNMLDHHYIQLVSMILNRGNKKQTRNGEVLSLFGAQINHSMQTGFPLLTTKKVAFKTMVAELLWFLKGRTDLRFLLENNCNIWNGDAFKYYLDRTNGYKGDWPDTMEEFIERIKTDDAFNDEWGYLGPIYGKQWRSWETNIVDYPGRLFSPSTIDQLSVVLEELKSNPDSRRLLVNAWNVTELHEMTVPPCHFAFQLYTRELDKSERQRMKNDLGKEIPERAISLIWYQRSCDVPLGLPFNIASYGLLLEIIAKKARMLPENLTGFLGDAHIYANQIEGVKEQLQRQAYDELPALVFKEKELNEYQVSDFVLLGYQSHSSIPIPLSN
jgi:thymidylate synthase